MHELEAPADDARAAEQHAHLVGRGVGGDVEILGFEAGDQVAHGAADDIGLVSRPLQRLADAPRPGRHQIAVDAVAGVGNGGRLVPARGIAPEDAAQKLADHRRADSEKATMIPELPG